MVLICGNEPTSVMSLRHAMRKRARTDMVIHRGPQVDEGCIGSLIAGGWRGVGVA